MGPWAVYLRVAAVVGSAALLVIVAGCASAPEYAPIARLKDGTDIQLTIAVSDVQVPDALGGGESIGKRAGQGAGVGAGAGAASGLQASVYCGPFVLACAPFMAVFGAGAGAVLGTVGGGAVGAVLALPAEKAQAVEAVIADLVATTDFEQTLREEFIQRNSSGWNLVESERVPELIVGIEGLYLQQYAGNELSVEVVNSVVIAYGPGESQRTKRILYRYSSERAHVDAWVDADGAALKEEIRQGFGENVRRINASLRR